ncbi:MAG: hypothetical protein PF692_06820 [Kiritimatiellae bacterium]|jgi:hypothetical protein|nr:hypothetical protein [Kiritimatiellia bacterium]
MKFRNIIFVVVFLAMLVGLRAEDNQDFTKKVEDGLRKAVTY